MLSVLCEGKGDTGKKDIVGKNWVYFLTQVVDWVSYTILDTDPHFFFPENLSTKHVSEFLDF